MYHCHANVSIIAAQSDAIVLGRNKRADHGIETPIDGRD
jgi:hypothetical protein